MPRGAPGRVPICRRCMKEENVAVLKGEVATIGEGQERDMTTYRQGGA